MTTIIVYKCRTGDIAGFRAEGHAGARAGRDIVCSAVSVLTQTAVNALEAVAGIPVTPLVGDGLLEMFLPGAMDGRQAQASQIILRTIVQGLTDVQQSYPKHVRVLCEEWRNEHASNESATVRP
jgi:uncharacterized protein YsxB (DUF464 family)